MPGMKTSTDAGTIKHKISGFRMRGTFQIHIVCTQSVWFDRLGSLWRQRKLRSKRSNPPTLTTAAYDYVHHLNSDVPFFWHRYRYDALLC